MSKSNLYAASNQWAVRPADERFWTLTEARDACKAYADTAEEVTVDFGAKSILADDDGLYLTLDGGRGNRKATFTNWGFSQMCRLAGAPADYIRKLPPHLMDGINRFESPDDALSCSDLLAAQSELESPILSD